MLCFAGCRWGNRYTKGDRSLGTVRQDLLKRKVWWFNCVLVLVNVLITVLCSLDTENVAVPVFAVCIILPVLLQFSGGVFYMYFVAPLKMLLGGRKDKDENYNALFEERFNARAKKKTPKTGRPSMNEGSPPGTSSSSSSSANSRFIRRATSMEAKQFTSRHTKEVIVEEEIDSDEEAELQKQFQKSLLADLSRANGGSSGRSLEGVRSKLNAEGTLDSARPGHASSLGRVDRPGPKGRRSPPS